jgi:hypothetical protein
VNSIYTEQIRFAAKIIRDFCFLGHFHERSDNNSTISSCELRFNLIVSNKKEKIIWGPVVGGGNQID